MAVVVLVSAAISRSPFCRKGDPSFNYRAYPVRGCSYGDALVAAGSSVKVATPSRSSSQSVSVGLTRPADERTAASLAARFSIVLHGLLFVGGQPEGNREIDRSLAGTVLENRHSCEAPSPPSDALQTGEMDGNSGIYGANVSR